MKVRREPSALWQLQRCVILRRKNTKPKNKTTRLKTWNLRSLRLLRVARGFHLTVGTCCRRQTRNFWKLSALRTMTKLVRNTTGENGNDAEEKDETCSILSSTGIEISRKNSFNYSSAEVMAVKGRRLSLNLSHISVGGKATTEQETMKNTSENDISEREVEERKNFTENGQGSPRRSEGSPPEDKSSKSPRNSVPATPSIGKVSLINAKVISIPLPRTKEDPGDKVTVKTCNNR